MSISFASVSFPNVLSTAVDCDTEPFEATRVAVDELSTLAPTVEGSTLRIANLL